LVEDSGIEPLTS